MYSSVGPDDVELEAEPQAANSRVSKAVRIIVGFDMDTASRFAPFVFPVCYRLTRYERIARSWQVAKSKRKMNLQS